MKLAMELRQMCYEYFTRGKEQLSGSTYAYTDKEAIEMVKFMRPGRVVRIARPHSSSGRRRA